MSVSEVKRQKKLAKKRAKDKARHKLIAAKKQALASLTGKLQAASQGKILGCYRCDPPAASDSGMKPIMLIRQGANGMVAAVTFLVDFWCLGVKDCAIHVADPSSIEALKDQMRSRNELTPIEPSSGRTMVELAVSYAATLGLSPHADYSDGKILWGDIPVGELPGDVELGFNGKPLYIAGPYDDLNRQREVLKSIEASVGEGNYDFEVSGGLVEDDVRLLD